jgi:catechol 2,3-dioxygenase-like lactoylglutathione lyase family enzyme
VITGLDHVAVAVRDFDAAVEGYRRLLGVEPELEPRDGAERAWFHFPNMALELIAAAGEGPAADRVRARLESGDEGMWISAFQVADLAGASKLAARRGLDVDPAGAVTRVRAAGLDFVLTPGRIGAQPSRALRAAPVASLDHVVVRTPDPDRALGLYGAKFGMDLRLDRENPQWGARQLFFRVGDSVWEVGASLKHPPSDGPDSYGGLAWRVADPDAAQAEIAAAGFDVSEVRTGRKPGTKVFTVRNAPAGVPTLMLSAEPQPEPA